MNNFFQYLFEVSLASSILFLGYLIIKNWLSIRIKRFYLLACIILPLIFPLVEFNSSEEAITAVPQKISQVFVSNKDVSHEMPVDGLESNEVIELPKQEEVSFELNWSVITTSLYLGCCIVLFGRFLFSLISIYRLTISSKRTDDPVGYFLTNDTAFTGASFFNLIFIHQRYVDVPAFNYILSHELIHRQRFHSLDILLSEFFVMICWINPTSWFLRKEIRLNTEYEADYYTAKNFGNDLYSNMLVELSTSVNPLGMNSFSARDTRKRISQLIKGNKNRWVTALSLIPFIVTTFWLISCEPQMTDFSVMDPKGALENVKTVTTRYISHQKDTQQKDGNIIAIAYYLPDGTVDKVEQHMTYPYDYEKPFEREFLTSPKPTGVLHILDGFELGQGENNILYGNDWPKYNAVVLSKAKSELYRRTTTIDNNEEGLPIKFTLTEELVEDIFYQGGKRTQKGSVIRTLVEEYKYYDGKVLSHTRKNEKPESDMIFKNQKVKVGGSRLLYEMNYKYDGENLIEVSGRTAGSGAPITTKIEYENGIMKSSSYFRNNKKYHNREFYYDQSGLKTRTEIFNVYGEPEYTITYDYEYY